MSLHIIQQSFRHSAQSKYSESNRVGAVVYKCIFPVDFCCVITSWHVCMTLCFRDAACGWLQTHNSTSKTLTAQLYNNSFLCTHMMVYHPDAEVIFSGFMFATRALLMMWLWVGAFLMLAGGLKVEAPAVDEWVMRSWTAAKLRPEGCCVWATDGCVCLDETITCFKTDNCWLNKQSRLTEELHCCKHSVCSLTACLFTHRGTM